MVLLGPVVLEIQSPYVLFVGDAPDQNSAKTALGIAQWRPDRCIGQIRLDGCAARLDLPELDVAEAARRGAKTLVVGLANRGGTFADSWLPTLFAAVESGLDLASGMHRRLSEVDRLADVAAQHGRQLHDVRHAPWERRVADGSPRSGRRLLTVGTDCSVGKMYAALALEKEMRARGLPVDFRATGQTGILVDGRGIPVDAIVGDFLAGAVEALCPAASPDHWDVVEGQGSLFHPSFAGVSLGLLHGAQAEALVLCHEPTRPHMRGLPGYRLPDLRDCIARNEEAARLTAPGAKVIGVCVNTAALDAGAARECLDQVEKETGLPTVDPLRDGTAPLVDRLGDP